MDRHAKWVDPDQDRGVRLPSEDQLSRLRRKSISIHPFSGDFAIDADGGL
jgi:hypothetical protein